MGGSQFSRGHLYRILENPLYAGRIAHKEQTYPGQHPAIVHPEVWDALRRTLAENSHARLVKAHSKNPSLLAGLLYDEHGRKLVATHANKNGRRYRYYVSVSAGNRSDKQVEFSSAAMERGPVRWRLPAAEIEGAVVRILSSVLRHDGLGVGQSGFG